MNSVSLIVSPINSVNWLTLIIGIIGQKNSDEIFILYLFGRKDIIRITCNWPRFVKPNKSTLQLKMGTRDDGSIF